MEQPQPIHLYSVEEIMKLWACQALDNDQMFAQLIIHIGHLQQQVKQLQQAAHIHQQEEITHD